MHKLLSDSSFVERYKRSPEIIEFGFYYKYLNQYKAYLENNQLLVLLHDDILGEPLQCVQKTYKFLGIDDSFVPESLNSRPQKVMYSLPRLKLLSFRNQFRYTYNKERTRLFPKKMNKLDKIVVEVIDKLDTKVLSKFLPNNKPKVSFQLEDQLYQIYKDDMRLLENLIERKLDRWHP